MFFKKKEIPTGIYKGDPLWMVALTQLRTQALCLSPYFQNVTKKDQIDCDALIGYQKYESFLSQLEDCNDLTNILFLKKSSRRSTRLAQVAEDIGENFGRRFGATAGKKVMLLVDDKMPSVKSYPPTIMRIIDCLVRAGQRLGADKGAVLRIEEKRKGRNSADMVTLSITCMGFCFGIEEKRLRQSLEKFCNGKYAQCINDLGMDLCAALHLAGQIGAVAEFVSIKNDGLCLEVRFDFERSDETMANAIAMSNFYFLTQNEQMAENLRCIAKFHGVEALPVSQLSELPSGARLVFDATQSSSWDLLAKKELLPSHTVFLAAPQGVSPIRTIVGQGFRNFITPPLVSSKIMRSLFGVHDMPTVTAAPVVKPERPLRVMVVDDTNTARIIICDHLESKGHSVIEADDGSEVVESIKRGEEFDLIICDLNMCHIDGLTMVNMLREMEKGSGKRLPIAIMTAFRSADGQDELESAGVNKVLIKPVTPNDIDTLLESIF